MAKENFNSCLSETLSHEGGWADNPKDPGGATMKGITLATFRRWKPKATKADLRAISAEMLQKIYRVDYWDPVKGDILALGVDLAAFDYAVNSGPGTAWKALSKVLGGADHETVKKLCARRLSSYQALKHWTTFGKGWTRRIAAIEAKGVAWALAAKTYTATPVKEVLTDEAVKAKTVSTRQAGGATGSAGVSGGAMVTPEQADQIANWILGGVVVAGIALLAYLVLRSVINKQRADAYAQEAQAL
ncbi:lysozyme family protein [Ochrobactrum sp. BH3]|nr:lysozyme family protein [Ochrobactrum sp. BH3]